MAREGLCMWIERERACAVQDVQEEEDVVSSDSEGEEHDHGGWRWA